MTKSDIIRKLTSRKLWLAVSEFVAMLCIALGVAQDTVTTVVAIIMAGGGVIAYILAEGWADANSVAVEGIPIEVETIITDEAKETE